MIILLELFITFFKIGLFSFGGGYAMISLLQQEAVSRNWMTVAEFTDIVAISQITPGPIAVNMATFVGYREAHIFGSLIATLGISLPSLIIVITLSKFFTRFYESRHVSHMFWGLRPAVAGLILAAAIQIAFLEFFPALSTVDFSVIVEALPSIEWRSIFIAAVVFFCIVKFKISPIILILASALAGLVLFL